MKCKLRKVQIVFRMSPRSVNHIPYPYKMVLTFLVVYPEAYRKGPFTKDVRLTPGEGGLRNPDVQLLFECDSIVSSGRRGRGSRNPGFSRMSFVNGPFTL